MTTIQEKSQPRADAAVNATPLTAVTVHVTGGVGVLASATGDFEIDTIHGVIHANVFPPTIVSNGGPDTGHTYVLRGTQPGGQQVALVGLAFFGVTSTGTYKFANNMSRRQDGHAPAADTAVSTPITQLRIAGQRDKTLVATAPNGMYLHAPGHDSQVIAVDAVAEPGRQLTLGALYVIAANGMPATMNLQLDHIETLPDGTLSVFYELTKPTNKR
jgi:hypothetical protein